MAAGHRTFWVGVAVGGKGIGWPFGRLDVSADRIGVRCWPVAWVKPCSAGRSDIRLISVETRLMRPILTIMDVAGNFAKVTIELAYGPDRVIGQLRELGYLVDDRR